MTVLLLALQVTLAQTPKAWIPEGAWLQNHVEWSNAPADVSPHLETAQALVLYFGKDRKFALIYCTVGREQNSPSIIISNGDPRGIYAGRWELFQAVISVKYQLIEATIPPPGQKLPGPMQKGSIKMLGHSALTFNGKAFHRAPELDRSVAVALHVDKPAGL